MTETSSDLSFAGPDFDALLADLASLAGELKDSSDDWPRGQFERLAEAGVLGWVIPREYGGSGITRAELIAGYERLAAACLTTTFVLTQRNGACQRIAGGENDELKADLLPGLCSGETFATVGISHLTTSRQHLKQPAVEARLSGDRLALNGTVPWVTGAGRADVIVTGGTCEDGRQVLVALPSAAEGVSVNAPPRMLSMNASQTGSVSLENVTLPAGRLIAGPVEGVMKRGRGGGAGSLVTSALAVGAAAASISRLQAEADKRPDLEEIYAPLEAERAAVSADLGEAAAGGDARENPALAMESIRQRANSLVLRSAQAYLAAAKGAGFLQGHPAERAVREAMFFLVWSCPQPVLEAALREFACILPP